MTINLENQLMEFVDKRLEEELWEKEEETEYAKDAFELTELARKTYGKDSREFRIILKLSDLYGMEVYKMQEKAYKIGFKDGLNIKNVF